MSKNEWKKWVGVVGRMLLAYALVFAQGAWAGQNQVSKDKAASPQKAAAQQAADKQSAAATTPIEQTKQAQGEESESAVAEEKPSRDGSHEGIKVHGHWTIEVRNPDGNLVTHREFENSLDGVLGGPIALAGVFARHYSVGVWSIVLGGTMLCQGNSNIPGLAICNIEEPLNGLGIADSSNLTVVGPTSLTSNPVLVLSGTVTSPNTGQIQSVVTGLVICPPTIAPPPNPPTPGVAIGGCLGLSRTVIGFTTVGLATPIQVSAGQIIAATVTISFS